MANDKFQQAVEAFQAGDRERASELLEQVLAEDPKNDNAWYFLAAAQTDPTKRREYLNRVLEINPEHKRAREVLDRLNASEEAAQSSSVTDATPEPTPPDTGSTPVEPPPSAEPPQTPRRTSPVRPLDPAVGKKPGEADSGGFAIPIDIPGMPVRVSAEALFRDGFRLFLTGLDVLQRKQGVLMAELGRATWWRFWLLIGWVAVIMIIPALFAAVVRGPFVARVVGALVGVPLTLLITYIGVAASHYWAKNNGGRGSLLEHAYTIALIYAPAALIGAVVAGVLSFSGAFVILASLISLAVTVYGMYVTALSLKDLHQFSDPNGHWITMAVFIGAVIIASIVLGVVLGVAGVGAGLGLGFLS